MKNKRTPFRIEWVAHSYEHKERSQDWIWAVSIVAIALAVVSAIFGNMILGLLIVVATFTLMLFINREPEEAEIIIDERGVTKDHLHYPYETLHSFHIDIEHSHPKVLIRSQKALLPLIVVPLGDADPEEVYEALSQFLKEETHSLPIVENILEFLGF